MDINQDSYIGYGPTTPQTIIHLVQSNVTLRLEDPRNDNGGSVNIEFKNGSTGNSDWKLSSSNSSFHIPSMSDNNTCNILSINSEGNIVISNDIVIGGNFVKSGEVFDISKIGGGLDAASYSFVSNYVNVSSNSLFNNMYSNFYTKDQINSCNYITSKSLPTNIVTQTILNSCNYVKDISFIKSYWKNIDATSKNSIYYGAPIKIGGNKSIDIADNYILDIIGNVRVNGVITQGWTGDGSTSGDGGGITANIFGSGSEITNLNANNIASGVLQVQYGGTGTSVIEANRILIGGTNSITSSPKLTWDNASGSLSVFDIRGIGSNITRIHASNISAGTINSSRLPIATNNNIGAIKRGSNISIDNNGSLSVNLDYYNGNARINGDLIVNSNLIVNGQTIQLNTSEYSTEKLDIINTGAGPSIRVKQLSPINNIVNISNYANSEVFNITKDGFVNFTERINGINVTQFSKIVNIDSNDSNCSNFVRYTSNLLHSNYIERDNYTSNFIRGSRDILVADYTERDNYTSNFIRGSRDILVADYTERDNYTCNFIRGSRDILVADYISRDSAINSSLTSAITTSAGHTSNYIDANKYTDDKVKTVLATSAGNNMAWNNSTKRFDVSFNSDYNSLNNKLTAGHNIDINANNVVSAVLDIYNGDSTINGNLTVNSNFVVLGTTTTLNVNNNSTDIFTASNIGPGPTLSVIQTSQVNNIVNISNYLDKEVFNITSEGNINFSEKINGIDKTQFSKIANIDANDSYCSNFVRIGDDILFLDYSTKIDDLRLYVETNDTYTSNYIHTLGDLQYLDYSTRIDELTLYVESNDTYTSNYIHTLGDLQYLDYSEKIDYLSDVVYERFDYLSATVEYNNANATNYTDTTSNILFSELSLKNTYTSNQLFDDYSAKITDVKLVINSNDRYASNYVNITSNILFTDVKLVIDSNNRYASNYVKITSNILFTDYISRIGSTGNNTDSLWLSSGNNNIYNSNLIGNVGIGTTNPTAYKLHVVGTIGASGNIVASYSDERLKHVTEYIKDVLPILDKINVFRYNCNDIGEKYGYDKSKKELGLSAQEIQKYYPELVSLAPFDTDYDPEKQKIISKSGEEYLTLNYERLVPVLLQGIKELKQEINELKVRLSKLE